MADQNQRINQNQNANNQNENDELFGGSDDIFENSDLLQPINTEVDTAHQVIKSQNDLNNFHGEIQSNNVVAEPQPNTYSESKVYIQNDTQDEEINQLKNPNDTQEQRNDLFEETPQENIETNNEFDNLYNENGNIEDQRQENNYTDNDDIFDELSEVSNEPIEEIPEIEEISENDQQDNPDVNNEALSGPATDYNETIEEIPEVKNLAEEDISQVQDNKEVVEQPEIVELSEIVNQPDSENHEEAPQGAQAIQEDDELDDINELDDIDDIDDIKDREDNEENTEGGKDVVKNGDKAVEPEDDTNEDDEEVEEGFSQNKGENKDEDDSDLSNNIQEEDKEVKDSSDDDIETNIVQDYEKYNPNLFKTDVQKKFGELQWKTEKIHELVGKDQEVGFDLLGGNDDRQKIIYKILSGTDYVEIEKEELNKEDESTTTNILSFELREDLENNMSVQLFVNDIELYDEIKDLQNDPNKKMQVLEKMSKFIFLLDEEYKKIQKYKKEKEERNAVKGVFRNF